MITLILDGNPDGKEESFLANMNLMIIGAVFFLLVLMIMGLGIYFLKKHPIKQEQLKLRVKMMIFKSIHQSVLHALMPTCYNIML